MSTPTQTAAFKTVAPLPDQEDILQQNAQLTTDLATARAEIANLQCQIAAFRTIQSANAAKPATPASAKATSAPAPKASLTERCLSATRK